MKPLSLILTLATLTCSPAIGLRIIPAEKDAPEAQDLPESDPAGSDLLRFNNGDIMHGEFAGLNSGIVWKRPDIQNDVIFKTDNVRQIVFKSGQTPPEKAPLSQITLINGDRIPGEIISLDDKSLVINSPLAGQLTIARNHLRSISPNAHGGELHYAGPFTSNDWVVLVREQAKEVRKREADAPEEKEETPKVEEKPVRPWIYSGASFYSTLQNPIVHQSGLPDVGRLRFKASWKNRLNISIAFHADFKRPAPPEPKEEKKPEAAEEKDGAENAEDAPEEEAELEEPKPIKFVSIGDPTTGKPFRSHQWLPRDGGINHALTYGSSYVLTLYSSYPTLNRCSFSETGQPLIQNLPTTRVNKTLGESGEAEFDLRFDRKKNLIFLFVDGAYFAQWKDPNGYAGKGGGIGFAANNGCKLRISDILVTSWNGTPDPARSLKHEERDILLLANGTDRFSGQIQSITDGKTLLKGPYAELSIPLAELSEIHLNANSQADPGEIDWSENLGSIFFNPYGRITVSARSADKTTLSGSSPILGELEVKLQNATLLQFTDGPGELDEWLTDF